MKPRQHSRPPTRPGTPPRPAPESGSLSAFDQALETAMSDFAQSAAAAPAGLEQRLLAHLSQALSDSAATAHTRRQSTAPPARIPTFAFAESIQTRRSAASLWAALSAHAAALALVVFFVALAATRNPVRSPMAISRLFTPPPPPLSSKPSAANGGGGVHDIAPAARGHLPKAAPDQILPPQAPPTQAPRLAAEPTVVLQPDLRMAVSSLPNLGLPDSNLHGISLGSGTGTGVGAGSGAGVGTGSGGNTGGGIYHVGGAVRPPAILHSVEAEFSEEARKARFSGNALVALVVDEQGNPTHIHTARPIGMGLDEKAVEAVSQYKFKPATLNGKPVKVELYVEVNFNIY